MNQGQLADGVVRGTKQVAEATGQSRNKMRGGLILEAETW